jgi:signal transduction histidine kinase
MPTRLPLARSSEDRVFTGLAAGMAEALGVEPLAVRAGFVLLTVAGGSGIALYLVALALTGPAGVATSRRADADPAQNRRSWALLCLTLAAVLLLRRVGLWVGDTLAWPVVLLVVGSLVVWLRNPHAAAGARRITDLVRDPPPIWRTIFGLALAAAGVGWLSLTATTGTQIGTALTAVAAVLVGLVVTAGPWALKIGRDLNAERRERIRSEEKAALSAHLHDSVLQTLTLIQRQSHDPDAIARLARKQEHELRDWLSGRRPTSTRVGLRDEIEFVARDVELTHGVAIDVVQVGDAPLDAPLVTLTEAVREALVNAAKHSGTSAISLYAEVDAKTATVFVRDRGCGFDPSSVAADRVGISASIRARLDRVGGRAEITSTVGSGTEVELVLPLSTNAGAA